jgi:hypothetical protein
MPGTLSARNGVIVIRVHDADDLATVEAGERCLKALFEAAMGGFTFGVFEELLRVLDAGVQVSEKLLAGG